MDMFSSEEKNKCHFADDVVSYLYNEMAEVDRSDFEEHLLGCTPCTDAFAEISDARYSVYEWQKIEFAPMATPHIVIPFEQKETVTKVSWFDSLRAVFSPRYAFASGAFALLLMLFSLVYLVPRGGQIDSDRVGLDNSNIIPTPAIKPSVIVQSSNQSKSEVVENKTPETQGLNISTVRVTVPKSDSGTSAVPVAVSANPPSAKAPEKGNAAVRNLKPPTTAPKLNDFDDDEDDSLRLADMLDDIDTKL
ncbi:MAG: zf-HC2 domain-containing protein [Blastocatellia bacterium]